MTTRSQDFKAEQLQSHDSAAALKAKAKAKTRTEHQAKAKLDHAQHQTHNEAPRAVGRSAYGLEAGTRKSTRATANRSKTDSSQRKVATARTRSPQARAGRDKEGGHA